jgi:hypothetical protein
MTLKEGRCPNCGSLLQLDAQSDADAFAIAAKPNGVTFPNLPQPKYNGPNLDPKIGANVPMPKPTEAVSRKKQASQAAQPVQPAYVMKDSVKVPDVRVPLKTKLWITAVIVVVVGIIAGISIPLMIIRDAERTKLKAAMTAISPFAVSVDQSVVIHGQGNNYLLIAAPAATSEEDAVKLFRQYCDKRAEIRGTGSASFAARYGDVTVRLVTPAGGFKIRKPADEAALGTGGTAIEKLP